MGESRGGKETRESGPVKIEWMELLILLKLKGEKYFPFKQLKKKKEKFIV